MAADFRWKMTNCFGVMGEVFTGQALGTYNAGILQTTNTATFEGPDTLVTFGQPTALRRAFTNLLDNAIRYGNEASVALSGDASTITVRFSDRGEGIPEAERANVLKPFARVEGSRSRATGGTGLGLAVVDAVVRRHNGTLQLADRDGGGLTVVEG